MSGQISPPSFSYIHRVFTIHSRAFPQTLTGVTLDHACSPYNPLQTTRPLHIADHNLSEIPRDLQCLTTVSNQAEATAMKYDSPQGTLHDPWETAERKCIQILQPKRSLQEDVHISSKWRNSCDKEQISHFSERCICSYLVGNMDSFETVNEQHLFQNRKCELFASLKTYLIIYKFI